MPRFTTCRICNRRLSNARSISVSMGPVCARKYGAIFEEALAYARSIGRQLDTGLLENNIIIASQQAYRESLRRRRSNQAAPEVRSVSMWSESRSQMETVQVELVDEQRGRVTSESGHVYETSANSCSCPHYTNRLQGSGGSCRHMMALQSARTNSNNIEHQASHQNEVIRGIVDQSLHRAVVQRFADIDWANEEAREGVLDAWRENRAFDGIYLSRDDTAWEELSNRAKNDWEYQYGDVLGGTGNSFGIEIEFELPSNVRKEEVAELLYEADLIDSRAIQRYHARNSGPGYFRLERDSSLENGLELVSPILFDNEDSWRRIELATQKLREVGAQTSRRTGGHIHIGIAPLDHRTYSWQRLARIGKGYEKNLYRMGAADADHYERTGQPGIHRGSHYAAPFPDTVSRISGFTSPESARRMFGDRYTIFNASNVDSSWAGRKPTVEMRYPNSTLNHKQWQAQVQVANSIVHQAAVINNNSPQSEFTPGLMQANKQLRLQDSCNEQMQIDNFRSFLDVLGNDKDRLAATWLFTRGRA
ncbi:amidoligase family protein [Paenibacillus sp. 1A_MP2]|uniref:amidoligase family protein n=1 Tax=Paenibacillus sp. 1A_MP2 TaxID=3457495 RepID=UPI003FCC9045